jgi:hypothetical protein
LLALGAAGLLLLVLIGLGAVTRKWLGEQERTTVSFADIDCLPPPGQERSTFLDEVQYSSRLPDQLRLLDDDLPRKLAEAFAKHPWVEQVEKVEILSSRRVEVRLVYRTPVLAVPLAGRLRAVDRNGVLLPRSAVTDGLPVYPAVAPHPKGVEGAPWGDPGVEEAARRAAP